MFGKTETISSLEKRNLHAYSQKTLTLLTLLRAGILFVVFLLPIYRYCVIGDEG
jgi:hypothetical protein